jgi:hypothetical protein
MAKIAKRRRHLSDGYSFVGFRPKETVRGVFGDPDVRIVSLERRSKKRSAGVAGESKRAGTTAGCGKFATCPAPATGLSWNWKFAALRAGVAAP